MPPGQDYLFKTEFVCRGCGKPSRKTYCDPCKVARARATAINNQRRAQAKRQSRNERKNIFSSPGHKTKFGKRTQIKAESSKRRAQIATYGKLREEFLEQHPTCPVTGERTIDIHHSVAREGAWLLLRRYWIAVSRRGHRLIEDHPIWAWENHLREKITMLYDFHVQCLVNDGIDIDKPLFYEQWTGQLIQPPTK